MFVRIGNNVGLYQSNSGVERRFPNQGQILQNLRCENISKHSARQSKLALNTPSKLSF